MDVSDSLTYNAIKKINKQVAVASERRFVILGINLDLFTNCFQDTYLRFVFFYVELFYFPMGCILTNI